jgi:hypothetical protein
MKARSCGAANTFRQIFRTSVSDENRAHAAVQLAKLYAGEGEIRKAIACNRWVAMSGVAERDSRFFFARFNVGIYYAELRQPARSLRALRELLDRSPERVAEIADLFLRSPKTRAVIDSQPGFAEAWSDVPGALRTTPVARTDFRVSAGRGGFPMIHRKTSRLQAVLGRFFLPALALGMLGLPGSAGGSPRPGPGTNNNGDDPLACPGDEVDSLPVVTAPTGLTLIGQPFEIRGVVLAIQGRGQTVVQQLAGGRVAVTLCGDFRVDFDRRGPRPHERGVPLPRR